MRLLHTTNRTFKEIFEQDIPKHPYAILSHRWGSLDDEVSYEDFLAKRKIDRPGFKKIDKFCEWAAVRNYNWVWIDTCCIDKRSSAELSEAINSMFAWYERSDVCVAYLADVHSTNDDFTRSDWFSRGWTLQELIAPSSLRFTTNRWESIGGKDDANIAQLVEQRTGIHQRVLKEPSIIKKISVARRMSWMAHRITTKIEDMAYCLLGIFDVNMPLLYGEGWKAFQRLQLEIMEQYEDESIFAWSEQSSGAADSAFHGLLARKPSQFAGCGRIVALQPQHYENVPPLRATARNVEICAGLLQSASQAADFKPVFFHQLRCANTPSNEAYLDLYVADSAIDGQRITPCFIALSRKSSSDLYSRVRAIRPTWKLADYSQCQSLARQPRQSFRARSSFSIEAIIDRVYSGNYSGSGDKQRLASDKPRYGEAAGRDDSPGDGERRTTGSMHSKSANSASTGSGTSPSRGDPLTAPSKQNTTQPKSASQSHQPARETPTQPKSASHTLQPPRHSASDRPHAYSKPTDNHLPGATPPTYAYPARQPLARNYPQSYKTAEHYPTGYAGYGSYNGPMYPGYQSQPGMSRPPDERFKTACGFYPCYSPACHSEKAKKYAAKLRLSGHEWHDYANKLMRAGWDLKTEVPSDVS